MNADFPPPGRVGRMEGWMRRGAWRRWLVLGSLWAVTTITLLFVWIAVAYFRASTERDAAAVALNFVITGFLAVAGLIIMHRAAYRWFWHIDRKTAAGKLALGDRTPDFGSEKTAPPPDIAWPWSLRLRHALIYLIGIATLLYVFSPMEHQRAIARFIIGHSAGRSSAGSLTTLLVAYLPMVVIAALAMLLTHRQMRRRNAGLLQPQERLLLAAETNWLFSFGLAFGLVALLCKVGGGMVLAHL